MTDLISRDVVLSVGNVRKVTEYDESGFGMTYHAVPVEAIKKIEAVDAVPVVHEKDIRSSVITVKDSDGWQDRIILADESTQVCAVYYADDSERVPVVHARWNEEDGTCSACCHEAFYDEWTEPKWDYDWDENLVQTGEETRIQFVFSPYCPNCGARMDGE